MPASAAASDSGSDTTGSMPSTKPHDWKELPPANPDLAPELLDWYTRHGRDFPWRADQDPYRVLCVEMMLQRTRAESVRPTYEEFVSRYSDPGDLVSAGPSAAQDIFEELGLLWRAEFFWKMHQRLVSEHNGEIPCDRESLLELPGVGHYVASAVRVFAFGFSETVIDSNVLRVLGRYHGIEFSKSARRSARVADWAATLAPENAGKCRRFNWAILDHGALVCRPRNPRCAACPIAEGCWFNSREGNGIRSLEPEGEPS